MELPARFRELPAWAAVLGALLGILALLTGLSMVLGIVFAGIAVGIELGSPVFGLLAALLGLLIVVVPVAAFLLVWSTDDESESDVETDVALDDEDGDPVDDLRQRYVDGEIDEVTFEREMDELLADSDGYDAPAAEDIETTTDATNRAREKEK